MNGKYSLKVLKFFFKFNSCLHSSILWICVEIQLHFEFNVQSQSLAFFLYPIQDKSGRTGIWNYYYKKELKSNRITHKSTLKKKLTSNY